EPPPPPKPNPRRPPPKHAVPRPLPPRPVQPPPVNAPMAAEAPPPATPAPVASAAAASAVQVYTAAIRARVQANLEVPPIVRMLHIGGVTRVAIRLAPSGALLSASVAQSSGNSHIDEAALRSVHSSTFPPFSPQMPSGPLTFILSVKLTP
ncbi:MAG TPA: cell envelope integrity protein TolA, partial [Rhodopila sp.]|nr:cell envelope integrity protein TolA [Rhodopila sp.]